MKIKQKSILAPNELIRKCKKLSEKADTLKHSIIGYSEKDNPREIFTYGFVRRLGPWWDGFWNCEFLLREFSHRVLWNIV